MEVVQFKTGENDKEFINNPSLFKKDYDSYIEIKTNIRNGVFLVYFFIPLVFRFFFPDLENYILLLFLIFSLMSFKLMGEFSEFLSMFFLSKIIRLKMERALFYKKNIKHLKKSMETVLKTGSINYSEDLLREFLRNKAN